MQPRFCKNKKYIFFPQALNIFFLPSIPDMASTFLRQSPTSIFSSLQREDRPMRFPFSPFFWRVVSLNWGSVPSLVWLSCLLSSLTWGLPSGPWSYFWIQTELSSCPPWTPSLSSEPASWTSLQDPSPSGWVRWSRKSESCNCWHAA